MVGHVGIRDRSGVVAKPSVKAFADRKTIFTLGVPRSGNTWLCRLLGDALESPIYSGLTWPSNADEGFDRPGPYVVRMRHPNLITPAQLETSPSIRIYRDPRDVIVSSREYWKSDWDDAIRRVTKTTRKMKDFEHIGIWTTFESLLSDTEGEILRILDSLGLKFVRLRIPKVIFRQSYNERRKNLSNELPYGVKHQVVALGHGKTGRWKTEIPKDLLLRIHEGLWFAIRQGGYETDPGWWSRDQ